MRAPRVRLMAPSTGVVEIRHVAEGSALGRAYTEPQELDTSGTFASVPRSVQVKERTMQLAPPTIPSEAAAVVDAETVLMETLERLGRLQLAALFGSGYDPDEYDAAVVDYRHARTVAEDARTVWEQAQRTVWGSVA